MAAARDVEACLKLGKGKFRIRKPDDIIGSGTGEDET
jgi:hypothetical protein